MSTSYSEITHESHHGQLRLYIIGFVLSIILTLTPYYLVTESIFLSSTRTMVIVLFAIIQMLLQLFFFLHVSTAEENRPIFISCIFTILMVLILVGGSLWIMWNLNYFMMDH